MVFEPKEEEEEEGEGVHWAAVVEHIYTLVKSFKPQIRQLVTSGS